MILKNPSSLLAVIPVHLNNPDLAESLTALRVPREAKPEML